jgi:hypothetical protein
VKLPLFLCSEGQLEEVLTVYTRLSHSASVFLRTNSRPSSATASASPSAETVTARPRKMSERDKDEKTSVVEVSVKAVKQDRDDGRELEHFIPAFDLPFYVRMSRYSSRRLSDVFG